MIKTPTGRIIKPAVFRKMPRCVECGKVHSTPFSEKCSRCIRRNLKKCEMCECVLRKGINTFYTYDIKEFYRENGIEFKISKEFVREFTYKAKPYHAQATETLCSGCVDWEKEMKHFCYGCKNPFQNNKHNYKLNGNFCPNCS